jgi:hypothetical protein
MYLDQAGNMHWYNLESGENKILGASQGNMLPWLSGDSASTMFKEDRVWDVRTGNLIFDLAKVNATQRWSYVHESRIAYADDADRRRIKIFDYKQERASARYRAGAVFANYEQELRHRIRGRSKFNAAFSKDGNEMVFITRTRTAARASACLD